MNILRKIFLGGTVFAADPLDWDVAFGGSRCVYGGDVATLQGFECLFLNILRVAATLAGFAFGAMILVGGFKLIFSAGDQAKTQAAQKTITFAVIGLTVTVGAWFVMRLIETFTGVTVTDFVIPGP